MKLLDNAWEGFSIQSGEIKPGKTAPLACAATARQIQINGSRSPC